MTHKAPALFLYIGHKKKSHERGVGRGRSSSVSDWLAGARRSGVGGGTDLTPGSGGGLVTDLAIEAVGSVEGRRRGPGVGDSPSLDMGTSIAGWVGTGDGGGVICCRQMWFAGGGLGCFACRVWVGVWVGKGGWGWRRGRFAAEQREVTGMGRFFK
ncbi:hypothetical protein TIFTF001_047697 [Ficus carica]|uniref:Uncharacterized protein n=1 Tax=Ficus carica TaxID=3494 RepID=A0AA87ZEZ9_FICCA|nr:hypothetical protein TIFTF001_047697 [Ficus carica]